MLIQKNVLKSVSAILLFGLASVLVSSKASADLTWTGTYRAEANKVKNAELDSSNSDKSYILHHLVLEPKIIAADGLTIFGRFDLLNDSIFGTNQQIGQKFGTGVRTGARTASSNSADSNVLSNNQRSGGLAVSQLYAKWSQEFGSLVVGRMPRQFGLGLTHQAGNGSFDHYLDTQDAIAYKFSFGNNTVMPMIGKVEEGALGDEDDVDAYTLLYQYENPETDLGMGVYFEITKATQVANDAPVGGDRFGGTGASLSDAFTRQFVGLFATQRLSFLKVAVEADLVSGKTGVKTAAGSEVNMAGYGFAAEISPFSASGKWNWMLKLGAASGDNPGTTDIDEGFAFNKNYDVAMLLFNHPVGKGDFLRSGLVRDTSTSASTQVDTEAISNVFYVSPSFSQQIKDRLSWGGSLTYAILNQNPFVGNDISKNLGMEFDANLTYKPYDRFTWVNQVGLLFPGAAFNGGTLGYDNKFAYGISSKAAISF